MLLLLRVPRLASTEAGEGCRCKATARRGANRHSEELPNRQSAAAETAGAARKSVQLTCRCESGARVEVDVFVGEQVDESAWTGCVCPTSYIGSRPVVHSRDSGGVSRLRSAARASERAEPHHHTICAASGHRGTRRALYGVSPPPTRQVRALSTAIMSAPNGGVMLSFVLVV